MKVNEMIYPEENSNISNNKSSSNKKTVISTEVTEPSENNDLCSFELYVPVDAAKVYEIELRKCKAIMPIDPQFFRVVMPDLNEAKSR